MAEQEDEDMEITGFEPMIAGDDVPAPSERPRRRADAASLVAGVVIAAFGLILLLDATGDLRLRFSSFAPLVALMLGATLLASGLTRRG